MAFSATVTLFSTLTLISILVLFNPVVAAPASSELSTRQFFQTFPPAQISTFKPFTFFAASAYCNSANILKWSCGTNCRANPNFQPIASGGDGGNVQFWYVGIDPTLQTIIVAHQGTDWTNILSVLTDINIILGKLDPILFPGISPEIIVHQGFAREHAKTATAILAAVQNAISSSGLNLVTIVGHSLGGSLALLDSVYLPLHLPDLKFRTITYSMPRVGNRAFADYIDTHTNLTHINNKKDIVPILPGRFLGFEHPQGEVHIQQSNSELWISCPGQDNTDAQCTAGDVKNIFLGNIHDHNGE